MVAGHPPMELALERVISMVTGAVAAAGQQRKHELEDTMHLRVEDQAPRGSWMRIMMKL